MLCLFFWQEGLSVPTREDRAYLEKNDTGEPEESIFLNASTKIFSYQVDGPHSFPVKETLMCEPSLIVCITLRLKCCASYSAVSGFEL